MNSNLLSSPNILCVIVAICTIRIRLNTLQWVTLEDRLNIVPMKLKQGWHPPNKGEHLSVEVSAHKVWRLIPLCRLRPRPVGTSAREATPTNAGTEMVSSTNLKSSAFFWCWQINATNQKHFWGPNGKPRCTICKNPCWSQTGTHTIKPVNIANILHVATSTNFWVPLLESLTRLRKTSAYRFSRFPGFAGSRTLYVRVDKISSKWGRSQWHRSKLHGENVQKEMGNLRASSTDCTLMAFSPCFAVSGPPMSFQQALPPASCGRTSTTERTQSCRSGGTSCGV